MINDRISALIDNLGVTPNRFSESISVNPTVIHNIIKGRRSKPSFEVLQKIISTYDEVNAEWLLRGSGKLWRKKGKRINTSSDAIENKVMELIKGIKREYPKLIEVYELHELVEKLIVENNSQKEKMIKLHERQDEIIKTLMKLKKNF